MPGPALGGRKAAGGVDRRGFRKLRQRDLLDVRAAAARARRGRARRRRRRCGRVASSISVCGTARRRAESGLSRRATRRSARISWATMASRTERVIADTVSSVVDKGTAPSAGTSRAVLLKPTMPCSAAGMRIEPPVSEPSATPGRTAGHRGGAAGGRPAGCARLCIDAQRRGVGGRTVVRVDAHAREGELRHVGAADDRGAGAAQPGHGRAVGAGRRCTGEQRRAGRRDLAGNVEQVLDRHREARQRAGIGARRDAPVGGLRRGPGDRGRRGQEGALAIRRGSGGDRALDLGGARWRARRGPRAGRQ